MPHSYRSVCTIGSIAVTIGMDIAMAIGMTIAACDVVVSKCAVSTVGWVGRVNTVEERYCAPMSQGVK